MIFLRAQSGSVFVKKITLSKIEGENYIILKNKKYISTFIGLLSGLDFSTETNSTNDSRKGR